MTNRFLVASTIRLYCFIFLAGWSTYGWSQLPIEWAKQDSIIFTFSNKQSSFRVAADTLANYLSTTRPESPTTSYLSELYHYTALWYRSSGDLDMAFQWADKALRIRQKAAEVTLTQLARTEYFKGVIFYESDLYAPASRWFDRGLQTLEKAIAAGDSLGANLNRRQYFTEKAATSAILLGDFARAELLLNKLPIYYNTAIMHGGMDEETAIKKKLDAAISWGLLYQKRELFPHADTVYQSIKYASPGLTKNTLVNLAILRGNQGYGSYLAGDYSTAERHVHRAIDILSGIPNKSTEEYTKLTAQYSFLAMCQQATNQFSALKTTVQKGAAAGAKHAKNGKAKQLGTLYTYAALGAAKAGDFRLADSLLFKGKTALIQQAIGQQMPILSNAIIYGEEELQEWLETKREIEMLKFRTGSFPEGRNLALATCDKLDTLLRKSWERLNLNDSRASILKDQRGHVQAAVKIALNLYQDTQNQAYLIKAYNYVANLKGNILKSRLLGPSIARSMRIPPSILEEKSRLELACLSIERQLLKNQKAKNILQDSLLNLDTQLRQLKSDLHLNHPAYGQFYQHQPSLDPNEIAKSLSPKQQLCEFHLTKDSILVFSISRLNGLRLIVLPKPPEMEEDIKKLMVGSSPSTNLFDALLAPVIEEGITRLQLIPDGNFWRLPFQSLKTPNGNYLIEEYAISYAYAAPVLLNQKLKQAVRKTRKKYMGFGIDYTDLMQSNTGGNRVSATQDIQNLKPLPFAASEVQRAAEIMDGKVFLNESVTKSTFLDQSPSADIIHLSMHGFLSIDPLANALVFHAGGNQTYIPFSMAEILTQRMESELTVLSSCHTGTGPIILAEGMFSIGSAFTVTGSRSTLTSTWEANDIITHDIMITFYEYLDQGEPKDIALQRATIEHLKNGSPAEVHPRNWANLSLNGSMLPINQTGNTDWWWGLLLLIPALWLWYYKRGRVNVPKKPC
ncbi:MAG: CHAT domain-containing protein [Lewinella sp.]